MKYIKALLLTNLAEYKLSVKEKHLSCLLSGFEDMAGLLLVFNMNTEHFLTHQTAKWIENFWKTSDISLLQRVIDSLDNLKNDINTFLKFCMIC